MQGVDAGQRAAFEVRQFPAMLRPTLEQDAAAQRKGQPTAGPRRQRLHRRFEARDRRRLAVRVDPQDLVATGREDAAIAGDRHVLQPGALEEHRRFLQQVVGRVRAVEDRHRQRSVTETEPALDRLNHGRTACAWSCTA